MDDRSGRHVVGPGVNHWGFPKSKRRSRKKSLETVGVGW